MKNQLIDEITQAMLPHLDNAQLAQLQKTLEHCLWNVEITVKSDCPQHESAHTNGELIEMFISAK